MKTELKIYAVVLNYNGYKDTINCINSLKLVDYENLNIVIVDNASTDKSYDILKNEFPDIPIVVTEYNKGFTGGMNAGAKYALKNDADYIFLTNNDMLYEKSFLKILVQRIQSDSLIGIVSPKVLYMHDQKTIYCAGAEFKFSYCGSVNMYQGRLSESFGNKAREITSAEGSCFLIKKEVFDKAGFYDERFFIYFEDIDLSDRVRKFFKIFYEPQSIVYHKAGAGLTWKDFSPFYYFYYTRNRLLYFSKKSNFILKVYATCFTLINSAAKTLVLLKESIFNKNRREKIRMSLVSLWEGTFNGLLIILGLMKNKDAKLYIKNKAYR